MLISSFVTSALLLVQADPTISFSCSVAPQAVNDTAKTDAEHILPTPLKIFVAKPRLSLVDSNNLQEQSSAVVDLMLSDRFPSFDKTVTDSENLNLSVFVQLGGKNVFGRSAYFFGDVLLTDKYCPDYKQGAAAVTCAAKFSALQLFDAKNPIPATATKVEVEIFRAGSLLMRQLTPDLMGEGENVAGYLEKYTRNDQGSPVKNLDKSVATLKAYFLYSAYEFEGANVTAPSAGKGKFAVKYGKDQAAWRIPVLSRQNSIKKEADKYFIVRQIFYSDKAPEVSSAFVSVNAEELVQVNFTSK